MRLASLGAMEVALKLILLSFGTKHGMAWEDCNSVIRHSIGHGLEDYLDTQHNGDEHQHK